MKRLVLASFLLNVSLMAPAWAQKLDLATHNSLIQKLESVADLSTKDAMVRQSELAHRLADLYAERARLLSMENQGQGEKIHRALIESDRRKSIRILKTIIPTLEKSERGVVLLQMAHLHSLLNEPQESTRICKEIERNPGQYDNRTVALAHIQLGDMAFYRGAYKEADAHFTKALTFNDNPRLGYTYYRLAWTHFNQGETRRAEQELIQLLETPKYFQSAKGGTDTSFQEDVSHDLATFMAKNDIDDSSIEILTRLSPEKAKKKNLIYLAEELDRTAKKRSALKVYAVIGAQAISFEEQVVRQVQVTRIAYDLGDKAQVVAEAQTAANLLKDPRCKNSQECTVAGQNLRRVLTDWAKAEERAPSAPLIQAFKNYTQNFDDYEMNYWAAQASTKRKQFREAFSFYSKAATTLGSMKRETEAQKRMYEGSLLGTIEVAELSKDADLRMQAYRQYLSMNPQGAKASEVRYQIAHWYYEKNDAAKAAEEFKKLALDVKMPLSLREKSADLCLDAIVLLKNEAALESNSLELAQALKTKNSEFMAIYRKAVLNQSARVINESQGTNAKSAFEAELQKLQGLQIANWPAAQQKQVIKNKVVLSYRLKNLDQLSENSKDLLALRGLTAEERAMAIQYLAWIAEVRMNFTEALRYMSQMTPSSKEKPDYHFKRAMLQELASMNPTAEYLKFMAIGRDKQKRQYAAHQIVIFSKRPQSDFKKYESILSGNPDLYRSAGIFAYEKSLDPQFGKKLLARGSFRNSPEGLLVSHQFAFHEFQDLKRQISGVRLQAGNDSRLKRALDTKIRLIKKLENLANQTIRQKDTSRQLVYLAQLAEENTRLANEILALPLPRGLKAQEREAYLAQVRELVQPYQAQSQAIQAKTLELWKQAMGNSTFQSLYSWSVQKQKPGAQLAALEINILRASARSIGLGTDPFGNLTDQSQKVASEAQLLKLKIQKNPFNSDDLEKMKNLQISLGSGPMVAYLDQRLNEIRSQGGRN